MPNYIATNHVTVSDSTQAVLALEETYLETLDSTTQAAWLIKVLPDYNGQFKAVTIHKDTA